MDLSMPGMDGIEATRLIRAQEAETGQARTPIIAVTAHVLKDAEAEVRDAGMDGYIGKPMRKADVLDLLSQWVGGSDQTAAQA